MMTWINAKIRDASVGVAVGTKVLLRISDVKHTSIYQCWWVYDGVHFRQVSEEFGGAGLYKILTKGKEFSRQDKIEARFAKFFLSYQKLLNSHQNGVKSPKSSKISENVTKLAKIP